MSSLLALLLLACFPWPPGDDTAGGTSDGGTGDGGHTRAFGDRGVWAWQDSGDPYGTLAVVGDVPAEEAMIADLIDWGVDRVYGSYGNRAVTEPEVIADWNERLHDAGIESHVLMGDPAWTSSREWAGMEELINNRLLDYNTSRSDPDERFDGLHLDIEPHAAALWSTASESDKYWKLFLLEETYDVVRGLLDAGSGASLPIQADLPVWYDKLPPALGGTGQIGWESSAQRDAWFLAIGSHLDSVSMMAYENPSETSIISSVSDETALFPGSVRVGLNEEVGTTWATIDDLFSMAEDLEAAGKDVDLHSYAKIRAELP